MVLVIVTIPAGALDTRPAGRVTAWWLDLITKVCVWVAPTDCVCCCCGCWCCGCCCCWCWTWWCTCDRPGTPWPPMPAVIVLIVVVFGSCAVEIIVGPIPPPPGGPVMLMLPFGSGWLVKVIRLLLAEVGVGAAWLLFIASRLRWFVSWSWSRN